ncbi:hypothetical protein KY346_04085 [Candidatus Woesearchaeota archaeon]|nr:hypothetical protein [Candidatus Woesearchaeota archaeon]
MTENILVKKMNLEKPYDAFVKENLIPILDKEDEKLIHDSDCWDGTELREDVFKAKYFILPKDVPDFIKKLDMKIGKVTRPENYLNQNDICFLLEDAESMAGIDATLKELKAEKAVLQDEKDELDDRHSELAEKFKQYKDDAEEDIASAEEELHFQAVYEQALEDEKRALKAEEKKLRQKLAKLIAMDTKRVQKGLSNALGAGEPADVIKLKNEKDELRAKNRSLNTEIEQARLSLQRVLDQQAEIDEAAEEREFYDAIHEQDLQEKLQEAEKKRDYSSAAESKAHHKARHMEDALKRIHGDPEGLGEFFYNLWELAYEFNYEFSTGTFEPKWIMGGASLTPGKVLDSDGLRDMTKWEKIKEYSWKKIRKLPLIGFPLYQWKRRFNTWPSAKELSYFIKCIHKAFVEIEEKDPEYAMKPNRAKGYSIRDASEVFAENNEELRQKIVEEAGKLGKPISDKNTVSFNKPAESGELKELYSALDALMQEVDYKPKEDTAEDGTHFEISPSQKYIDFIAYLGRSLTKDAPETTKEAVAAKKPAKEITTLDEVFREPEEDAEMKTTLTPEEFFGDKKPEPKPVPEPKIESGRKVVTLEDFFGAEAVEKYEKTSEADTDKLAPEEMLPEAREAAAEAVKAQEEKIAQPSKETIDREKRLAALKERLTAEKAARDGHADAVDDLLPAEAYTEQKTPVPERVEPELVLEETMDEVVLEHSPTPDTYEGPEQAPAEEEEVYVLCFEEESQYIEPAPAEEAPKEQYAEPEPAAEAEPDVWAMRDQAYDLGTKAAEAYSAGKQEEAAALTRQAHELYQQIFAETSDSDDKAQIDGLEQNLEFLQQ